MKKIITISRDFGSAGGTIGKRVADKLGFEYFDKELIIQAARDVSLDIEKIIKYDEKVPVAFGFAQSLFDLYAEPVEESLFEAQKKIIRKIAEHGKCVIVGRNADHIVSAFDDVLKVFIHADENWRIQYLKNDKMKDKSVEKIADAIHSIDRHREKFCKYWTHKEFGDAKNYDITLNTSSLGIDKCVEIIYQLAK